jgi:hypothetical protein
MATYWSTDYKKINHANASMYGMMIMPIEDAESSTEPPAIASYSFDYSLMTIVFAILIFLWMQ